MQHSVATMFISDTIATLRTSAVTVEKGIVTVNGLQHNAFFDFIKDHYGGKSFIQNFFVYCAYGKVMFHEFFIPEFVYLITRAAEQGYLWKMKVEAIIEDIFKNTWFKGDDQDIPTEVDLSQLQSQINPQFKPTPVQTEFLTSVYYQKKTKMHLRGYLVALEPGMGKSKLSLFLGTCLHKKHFVIIAPLSTVSNVWLREVNETFAHPKKVWVNNQNIKDLTADTEVVIVNYEGLSKISDILIKLFNPKDTIVVIDECHNYKDIKAKRTQELLHFTDNFACDDILPMSGTPIKAYGVETFPIFRLLDIYFTPEVEVRIRAFRNSVSLLNELLKNRLGMMMYRKLKVNHLELPEKHEAELKIKIPNGEKYTIEVVKEEALKYKQERLKYYHDHYERYDQMYKTCLALFEATLKTETEKREFGEYKNDVKYIQTFGASSLTSNVIQRTNIYEKEKILPALPIEKRKDFKQCKSVIKYVELKVMGEVLGSFIGKLRAEMTTALIGEQVRTVITTAKKKTILFSSYVDTLKIAEEKCKSWQMRPMVISGENSKEAASLLNKFKNDVFINPLIASLSVMSTGHTINEANTVIFLNVPFRSVDYDQASDRCYRIGQDTDVYIYKLVLDTDDAPNLSTRMHDIIAWSKEQFDAIIGNDEDIIKQGYLKNFVPVTISDLTDKISNILKFFKI